MNSKLKINRGFTLIELLVVVAIIGILSTVVLSSLNSARERGRDARRLADLKQIQNALEIYFDDNGHYPERTYAYTSSASCGGNTAWCGLVLDLAPFISSIPGDPLGHNDTNRYRYDSNSGDNYQTYGMVVDLESTSNSSKESNDGGYYPSSSSSTYVWYEVGQQPTYCMNQYTGGDRNWWISGATTVCAIGN